jgi:hypothetical protein
VFGEIGEKGDFSIFNPVLYQPSYRSGRLNLSAKELVVRITPDIVNSSLGEGVFK